MSRGYDFDEGDSQRNQEVESRQPTEGWPSPIRTCATVSADRKQATLAADPERFPAAGNREQVRFRGRQYQLSSRERDTLREIGRFRIIATHALLEHRYSGMAAAMRTEIARLQQKGLLQRRSVSIGKNRNTLSIVALTREGALLLRNDPQLPNDQAVYAGFVKPAEVSHDAAIYEMYHAEAAQIEAKRDKIRRVVLDYELKRNIYSKLAKERNSGPLEYARRQQEIADDQQLPLVDGKIALPDLRIEYETPEGELAHVDLELATEHYRPGQMALKARAGFKMYGFISTSRGRRAQWEGRELSAAVLSL